MKRNKICESFLHCPGIGESRVKILSDMGVKTWNDYVLAAPYQKKGALFNERILLWIRECQKRLKENDLDFFVNNLPQKEQWRILADYWEECSFFDLETSGLDPLDRHITVLCLYHKGKMYRFVDGENLEDFLEILLDIKILVSFNGLSFDGPVVLDHFNIPELPCVHLDLRWMSYHLGWRGGLKQIERALGKPRCGELESVDGWEAVRLWDQYIRYQDRQALKTLVEYCEEDVYSLVFLGEKVLVNAECSPEEREKVDSDVHPVQVKTIVGWPEGSLFWGHQKMAEMG